MYKQCNVSFEPGGGSSSISLGVSTPLGTREDRETNRMLQSMKDKYSTKGEEMHGGGGGGRGGTGFGLMASEGDYIYDDADETFRY